MIEQVDRPKTPFLSNPIFHILIGMLVPTILYAGYRMGVADTQRSESVISTEYHMNRKIGAKPALIEVTQKEGIASAMKSVGSHPIESNVSPYSDLLFNLKPSNPLDAADSALDAKQIIFDYVRSSPSITLGSGSKSVYVFFSITCVHCMDIYQDITAGMASSLDITWHLIPVNFEHKNSLKARLSALLANNIDQKDVSDAILEGISNGHIEKISNQLKDFEISQSGYDLIDRNTNFLINTIGSTPTIVTKSQSGEVRIFNSRPQTASQYMWLLD